MATRNSSSWTSINSADRSSVSGTERTERSDRTDRTDRTSLWTSLTSITSVESSIAPHLLLIVSQFLYSGWHIIGFLALKNGANPLVLALYRGSFASVLMFFFALTQTKGNHKLFKIDPNDYLRFVFLGFCSFVSVVGTIISFQYITPSHYAIFQPLVPCMATIISCSINLEKCTTLKVIGISVAALGAIIIESGAVVMKSKSDENTPLGFFIVLLQCIAGANLIVFQKSLLNKYEPAVVTYVYYSIGLIFTLLLCLIFHSQFTLKDFNFNGEKLPWLAVAYATLFTTLFALNVNSWSGKRLPPSVSTVYNTLQPVGTVILSYFLLNSVPNSSEWFGGIVASIGLIVTMYARCEEEGKRSREYFPVFTTAVASDGSTVIVPTLEAVDIEYQEFEDHNPFNDDLNTNIFRPPIAELVTEKNIHWT